MPISKIARKRINELHEYYSYEVIYRTIKFVEDRIRYNIVLKEYEKEIADFQKLFEEPKNDIDLDIINDLDDKPIAKPRTSDISEWLD